MKKDRLDYEFLPEAAEIEETPPSPFGRIILWTIVLLMVAAFLWSYFGKVDEEVLARGKVIRIVKKKARLKSLALFQ